MLPGRRESSTPEGGSPFDCAQGDTFFQSFIGMAPSATGGEEEALSLPQQVRQKQLKPWKLFLSHHRAGGVGIGGRRLFLWFFFCVVTKERTAVERRKARRLTEGERSGNNQKNPLSLTLQKITIYVTISTYTN